MIVRKCRDGSVEAFGESLHEVAGLESVKGLFILACDGNGFPKENVDGLLLDLHVPVLGGAFPAVLLNNEILEQGTVIAGLSTAPSVQVIPDLSSDVPDYDDVIDSKFPEVGRAKTMFVIVDGMGRRVNTLLDSLFNVFGLELNYIGGGAGSLSLKMKPCLFTNEGFLQDSAVLALVERECGIGIRHGMFSVSGPHRITEAGGNTVHTLDWKPAFTLYKEVIKAHPDCDPEDTGFYGVDTHFSLGINRLSAEKVVREPVDVGTGDSLLFTPEMKEGEFVDILRATEKSTIQSARDAMDDARKNFKGKGDYGAAFCFSCTARQKFLGERYVEEVEALYDGERPLLGALTIGGEIANSGRQYLDYLNRTCVVAVMEEP